jgi:NitT/TauT family transport system permease protein
MLLKQMFTPNAVLPKRVMFIMGALQLIFFLIWWYYSTPEIIPNPVEVIVALKRLIFEENLVGELLTTAWLCLRAMLYATVIGLLISYSSKIQFFKPTSFIVSQFRFLTLVGFGFMFLLFFHTGESYKTALLIFGILPFLLTGKLSLIRNIPSESYNYARTLRMNEWQVLWYVVMRGQLANAFDIVRQNFAIAWMMITMVESANRENGGIGALLVDQNRFGKNFDGVFAVQLAILLTGITIHVAMGYASKKAFPYYYLKLNKNKK